MNSDGGVAEVLAIAPDEPHLMRSVPQGFAPLHPAILPFLESTSCDLFAWPADQAEPQLLHSWVHPIGPEIIAALASRELDRLLVRVESLSGVAETLDDRMDKITGSSTTPDTHKFHLQQIAAHFSFEPYAKRRYLDEYISAAQQLGRQIADVLFRSDVTTVDLYRTALQYSSHSSRMTRIAAYAVLLAEGMGVEEDEEIRQIAEAAMLHQVGRLLLPPQERTPEGALTAEAREQQRRIPQLGYELLCDRDDFTFAQLMTIYQHQEHRDGSGYPVAIVADEIHPWAAIVAIAATFDARANAGGASQRHALLTSALAYLADHAYSYFDPKAVLWWISSFQQA